MSAPTFGDAAAIAGIGQTEFSRRAGRSELQLACESITAALADAGLRPADVDGLVSYTVDPVEETELVRSVGFPEIVYSSRIPYGGGGSMGVLLHAGRARWRAARPTSSSRYRADPRPIRRVALRRRQDVAQPHVSTFGHDRDAVVHAATACSRRHRGWR